MVTLDFVNRYLDANVLLFAAALVVISLGRLPSRWARSIGYGRLLRASYVVMVVAVFVPFAVVHIGHDIEIPHAVDIWAAGSSHPIYEDLSGPRVSLAAAGYARS